MVFVCTMLVLYLIMELFIVIYLVTYQVNSCIDRKVSTSCTYINPKRVTEKILRVTTPTVSSLPREVILIRGDNLEYDVLLL